MSPNACTLHRLYAILFAAFGTVCCRFHGGTEAVPHQVKLRCAGPASAVNWMLRAQPGQVFQVVLGQTESLGEYSVLWHVPVAAERVPAVTSFWKHISITERRMVSSLTKIGALR